MAALGAATHIADAGRPVVLYDANPYAGGHTATHDVGGGFLFDDGPHVSFTKDERIRDLLADNVQGAYEEVKARINNYWHGHWIPHPVQMNLHGLPTDLVVDIISDFVEARQRDEVGAGNYEQWLRAVYGDTFAETFPMVYGLKYHTTTMDRLTTDWIGPRMYRPDLDELVRGALEPTRSDVHYVTSFRYPSTGGFQSYLRPWLARLDIRLGFRVTEIDAAERSVTFANGAAARYDVLISSIPLPDLVSMIVGLPDEVRHAAGRLSFTSAVMVNLGVARDDISDAHISYVYDEEIVFPRLNFPHLLSRGNVPPGAGSIQVELYFSERYRPLQVAPEALIDDVVRDLRRLGTLRDDDELLIREARVAPYANVIYDHDRREAVATVHGYLDEIGITPCGRYGDWNHAWTDEAFRSGEIAAEGALLRNVTRPIARAEAKIGPIP
jgi:protoporphyrinogen oxidase